MENSPVGHRVAQVEAIDKGQKISKAFFLAFNSSKKGTKNFSYFYPKGLKCAKSKKSTLLHGIFPN